MSKLTLHVPDELVEAAKREASERHTSVSKLVSSFFRSLTSQRNSNENEAVLLREEKEVALPPLTSALLGVLQTAKTRKAGNLAAQSDKQLKDEYYKHLLEKHS